MRPTRSNENERARPRENEAGSSLVELTIAIAAAVTIVSAVLTATVRHSNHRQSNQERNLATLAALDTLERIRGVPFVALPSMDGTGFDVLDPNGNPGGLRPVAGDLDGLPGRLVVQPEPGGSLGGETMYRVTAVVEWAGIRDRSQVEFGQLMVERK